ncbi:MAG: L,D-transpeptidase [Bacteroidetes bacterium HGW-Bacteroidetes-4]|jgi:L,D-transpeptidase YbiS|nr:MAG: L,D-transpeptidase [Bacteroidetes bacterium HGW-Bacteroidetes-4]
MFESNKNNNHFNMTYALKTLVYLTNLWLKITIGIKKHKILLGTGVLIILLPLLVRFFIWQMVELEPEPITYANKTLEISQQKLNRNIELLNKKLIARRPKSYFLVINSSSNEFSLYKGCQLVKKDKCSTGSYILLKNGDQQQWMFKTPKGEFGIKGKTTAPVWKKPDWAFIEEGLPVPALNHYSRFEYGVLGDYALNLGQGYLIHGTLYQRFLGLPVTHGCIRLNDENLKLVNNALQIGSKVYIY